MLAVGAIAGNEDAPIPFGNAITWTKPDADGSEWISQVTLSGFPAGWVVSFTPNAAVTVTGTAQTGYTLSIAAQANEAALRAVLDSFAVQGPANSDADASITATATTTDADGSTATSAPVAVNVVVNPVSDTPVLARLRHRARKNSFILFGDKATWTKPTPTARSGSAASRSPALVRRPRNTPRWRGERHGDCRRLCHHRPSEARSAPRSTPSRCARPPTPTPT